MCRGSFSHQMSVHEYLYSPANSRTIMYVVAPTKRTTEITSTPLRGGGTVMGHLQARPATENSRNAVYPLVVDLAPLSAALPVVVLFGEAQYPQVRSSVSSART